VFHGLYGHGNQQTGIPPQCAALLRGAWEVRRRCDVVVVAKHAGLYKLFSELLQEEERGERKHEQPSAAKGAKPKKTNKSVIVKTARR